MEVGAAVVPFDWVTYMYGVGVGDKLTPAETNISEPAHMLK